MLPGYVRTGEQTMAARNENHADFARVLTSGLRETEAILVDLVGMDRLNEFDLGAVKAVFDEAQGWNPYAQYLLGELCTRGGYASLAEMWFMLAGMAGHGAKWD
jgi:hypothetical protein